MIYINKVLFDLSVVYQNLTQAETWALANTLTEAKFELDSLLEDIIKEGLFEGHYREEIETVTEQLHYVNTNIKTLGDALLCHETKIFEKRITLKELQVFGLN